MIVVVILVHGVGTSLFQRLSRLFGDTNLTETELSDNVSTPKAELSVDVLTQETELSNNESTPETELPVDILSPETELSVDVLTSETELSDDESTPETELSVDVPTPETELSLDISTPETEQSVDVLTPETELSDNESTPETELSVDVLSLELEPSNDESTPETEQSADAPTPETELSADDYISTFENRRNDENTYAIRSGIAVIFNNISYHDGRRDGTMEDENHLKTTLQGLGLKVTVHRDVDATSLVRKLQRVAKMDHSEMDCFVCVILSHGGQLDLTQEGEERMCDIIKSKDSFVSARELVDCLRDEKAPTLVNKPRLFFVQACRGAGIPATVDLAEDGRLPRVVEPALCNEEVRRLNYALPFDLPIYPEFVLAWATVPGYYAFRHDTGSPFIEYLCEGLRENREDDLLTVLTWVQNQVAIKYKALVLPQEYETHWHHYKQMPWVASMLTKNVYFGH